MRKIERHSTAFNRVYYFRRAFKGRMPEDECPIRLRGYSELVMGNLPAKLRKKLDTAIRRGYALECNTQLPYVLRLVEKHNPVRPTSIGYVGKTDMRLYMPTKDEAEGLCQELKALTVITDAFDMKKIRVPLATKNGMYKIETDWGVIRKGVDRHNPDHFTVGQLTSCFKEMRPIIDDWMMKWARDREAIARWCAADDCTIRVPFDTIKKEKA